MTDGYFDRLEAHLLGAVERQAQPVRRPSVSGLIAVAAVLVSLAVGAGAVVALRGHVRHHGPQAPAVAQRHGVLMGSLRNPSAYATGGFLFVASQVSRSGSAVQSKLMRVDPRSGRVQAVRDLDSVFDQALLWHGVLWMSSTGRQSTWLWRLDPRSLAERSRIHLSSKFEPGYPQLAIAGGWLWVAESNRLDRISLATGQLTAQVPIPGAQAVTVASNSSGTVLLVSEGGALSHIQRRDPHTGALLQSSPTFQGVTPPYIGGVFGDVLWISQSGGMMGGVERLSLTTLEPTDFSGAQPGRGSTGPPGIAGTNAIRAQVFGRTLWVTQPSGGPGRNYCGSPVTGVAWRSLRLPDTAYLLTVGPRYLYYAIASVSGAQSLVRVPISASCRRAVGGSPEVSHHVSSTPTAGTCPAGSLRLIYLRLGAFTFHYSTTYAVKNTGHATCWLEGFPSVRAYRSGTSGRGSNATPISASHMHGLPHGRVRLKPGAEAGLVVALVGNPDYSGLCLRRSTIEVTLPGTTQSIRAPRASFNVCRKPADDGFYVSPILPTPDTRTPYS